MDAALGVLLFGGLAVLGVVALVQSASRPSGRAQPGSRAGRPSYSAPVRDPIPRPAARASSASGVGSAELEALLLTAFNEALAEAANRSAKTPLRDEEIDDLVIERSLEAVMSRLGIPRREAAQVILSVLESRSGQEGSPKAKLRAIVADG